MALAGHRQGADLVLGRPARRQSGADRADGRRAQEPHVPPARRHGLQGDRGRLSLGFADRLRLRPLDHRERRDSRRRRDPGADPVPAGTDRAHLRGGQGREEGHPPLLQFDLDLAARGRLPHRPQGRDGDRGRRREAGQGARRRPIRGRISSSNIRPRVSPAPSSISRSRSARRSRTSSARRRKAADPQPAGDRRDGDAEHLRRPVRMVRPPHLRPRQRAPVRPSAQRPRHRGGGGGAGADGRRRPRRGHAVRQRRAHRQRRHRHDGAEPVHARGRSRSRPARRQPDQGDRRVLQPVAGPPAPPLRRRTRLHRLLRLASGRDQEGFRRAGQAQRPAVPRALPADRPEGRRPRLRGGHPHQQPVGQGRHGLHPARPTTGSTCRARSRSSSPRSPRG